MPGLCCSLGRTPSIPLGYADDIATCCQSKYMMENAMDVVYIHGCTCRYDMNATNVLVFSGNTREHTSDVFDRSFKLVP